MSDDKKICKMCIEKTFNLEQKLNVSQEEVLRLKGKVMALQEYESQIEQLREELRNCRRLCYKEQHRNGQLKRTLASFKDKFQGYNELSDDWDEVPEELLP
jgi:chromosome segregation ATPase